MGDAYLGEVGARASTTSRAAPEDVYDVIADLRSHLVWAGERAPDPTFKLLTMEAPEGAAAVGTEFTSTGANFNGTFHDRSVVTEATRPNVFVIESRSILRWFLERAVEKHLDNLARLAEERSTVAGG